MLPAFRILLGVLYKVEVSPVRKSLLLCFNKIAIILVHNDANRLHDRMTKLFGLDKATQNFTHARFLISSLMN